MKNKFYWKVVKKTMDMELFKSAVEVENCIYYALNTFSVAPTADGIFCFEKRKQARAFKIDMHFLRILKVEADINDKVELYWQLYAFAPPGTINFSKVKPIEISH
jgi:hypothetical protein